jgi:hypothetical protein
LRDYLTVTTGKRTVTCLLQVLYRVTDFHNSLTCFTKSVHLNGGKTSTCDPHTERETPQVYLYVPREPGAFAPTLDRTQDRRRPGAASLATEIARHNAMRVRGYDEESFYCLYHRIGLSCEDESFRHFCATGMSGIGLSACRSDMSQMAEVCKKQFENLSFHLLVAW